MPQSRRSRVGPSARGYLRDMTEREREPTIDEFIDDPAAKVDALGEVDEVRPAQDGSDPDEEYEHGPADSAEPPA